MSSVSRRLLLISRSQRSLRLTSCLSRSKHRRDSTPCWCSLTPFRTSSARGVGKGESQDTTLRLSSLRHSQQHVRAGVPLMPTPRTTAVSLPYREWFRLTRLKTFRGHRVRLTTFQPPLKLCQMASPLFNQFLQCDTKTDGDYSTRKRRLT